MSSGLRRLTRLTRLAAGEERLVLGTPEPPQLLRFRAFVRPGAGHLLSDRREEMVGEKDSLSREMRLMALGNCGRHRNKQVAARGSLLVSKNAPRCDSIQLVHV